MSAVIHVALSRAVVLSSNYRLHWAEKARRVKAIREMALVMTKHHRYPEMQAADCVVEVAWPDNRRHDAHNLQPSVKAAIDGIVSAGLLPDDNDEHLRSLTFKESAERTNLPGVAAVLKFTFTPAEGGD